MFGHDDRNHLLHELRERLDRLQATLHRLEKLMSGFTDLQQSVADVLKSASTLIGDAEAAVAALSAGTVTDQQLEDLATQLGSAKASMDAEAAKLAALAPPAATP